MRLFSLTVIALFITGCGPATPPPKAPLPGEEESAPPAGAQGMGSLPAYKVEELTDYFTKKGSYITRVCYQPELERRGRSFLGKVMLKMHISAAGKASQVQILSSELHSPEVEKCMIEEIEGWAMPELPNAVMWTWTFDFQPAY